MGLEVSHEVGGPGAVLDRLPLLKFSVDFLDFDAARLDNFSQVAFGLTFVAEGFCRR